MVGIRSCRVRGGSTILRLIFVLLFGAFGAPGAQESPARKNLAEADALLGELQQAFGANPKKYEALAKKLDAAVAGALAKTVWRTGADGRAQTFAEHPFFKLVEELSAPARVKAKKNEAAGLLERRPWNAVLELVDGLQYGSDRPIPQHENGFIELGCPSAKFPGYPELLVNQYLYGTHEIVGWRHGVELSKKDKLSFQGRGPKNPPTLEEALPAWEAIRVYLLGSLPDVQLFAIPRLTHLLHARLAEHRGAGHALDELFLLLDSRWNGFTFQTPYGKERFAVVQPIGALMADRKGFFYRFPPSLGLAGSGDLPFISDVTLTAYAASFKKAALEPIDFIQATPEANAVKDAFWRESAYATRYRALLEEFVRAILAPNLPYPEVLEYLDYPAGKWPVEPTTTRDFDVPRAHALLVWAYVKKDPTALADFLQELLSRPENLFPNDAPLPVALTLWVREREAELLHSVSEQKDDLAAEFWPYPEPGEKSGVLSTSALLVSFHAFHASATRLVRDTACAVVAKELHK